MKKEFRSFEDARIFARSLQLTKVDDWLKYRKSRPSNIPSKPDTFYKNKGWTNWIDFLGTENITYSRKNIEFRSFEDAKKFVQTLGFKSEKEWRVYRKSGKRPKDIPSNLEKTYKNNGWKGFGDFFGTGNIKNTQKKFLSFEDARKFVHTLNIAGVKPWRKYCKSNKKPLDIPSNPQFTYEQQWNSWNDWLGNDNINSADKEFRSFEDARKFVHTLNIKSIAEWKKYRKSGKRPDDIPSAPEKTYRSKWIGYGDWLGTGNTRGKNFRTFEDARKFVHTLGLKSHEDWKKYCKSGKKPEDIPVSPWITYKNKKST